MSDASSVTPGYYLVTKEAWIAAGEQKPGGRLRLRRGEWLITDSTVLGRFDQDTEMDWLPLEWVRGTPVVLDDAISAQIEPAVTSVSVAKLERAFQALVFVEPGEPTPDMPRPSLTQLETYLRERRILLASYQRR